MSEVGEKRSGDFEQNANKKSKIGTKNDMLVSRQLWTKQYLY
jgi:hypothetical protein